MLNVTIIKCSWLLVRLNSFYSNEKDCVWHSPCWYHDTAHHNTYPSMPAVYIDSQTCYPSLSCYFLSKSITTTQIFECWNTYIQQLNTIKISKQCQIIVSICHKTGKWNYHPDDDRLPVKHYKSKTNLALDLLPMYGLWWFLVLSVDVVLAKRWWYFHRGRIDQRKLGIDHFWRQQGSVSIWFFWHVSLILWGKTLTLLGQVSGKQVRGKTVRPRRSKISITMVSCTHTCCSKRLTFTSIEKY